MRRLPFRLFPGVRLPAPALAPIQALVPTPVLAQMLARMLAVALAVALALPASPSQAATTGKAGARPVAPQQAPRPVAQAIPRPVARPLAQSLVQPLARHDSRPIARLEDSINAFTAKATAQRTRLDALNAELDRPDLERQALRAKAESLVQRSRDMLPLLWVLDFQTKAGMEAATSSWDESDRRFTWLASALAQARQELESAQSAKESLALQKDRQAELRTQRDNQALELAATLSALLAKRFTLMKERDAPRQDKTGSGQQYYRLMALLEDLDFPALPGCPPLDSLHGKLPRPVKGRVAAAFAPPGGIALAVDGLVPVTAVHPGILAFSDRVDDLGQVVIVAHGKDAFSVYSHLSLASQGVGQPVAAGETLGSPGPYLPAEGSGMFFELRFQGKPFNPTQWLTAGQ